MYGWLSRAHATFTSAIENFAESVSSLNSMAASASANGTGKYGSCVCDANTACRCRSSRLRA